MSYSPSLTDVPTMIGMALPFERGEYARRLEAARAALQDAELDALVLFHQESMYYLFGYDQLGYWVYQAAVITPDSDEVSVLARVADHDLIAGLPFVGEVRTWLDDSDDDPARMTVDLLAERGALGPGKRVGIELRSHALLPYHHGRLQAALAARAEAVDASDVITELRLRKSPAEIEYVREAGRVMDAAYEAAFDVLRPGVTEADVLAATFSGMFAAGGHVPAIAPPLASGPRTISRTHGAATQRVIEDGELFVVEVGGCRHRYHAVGVQSKWVGDVPVPVRDRFAELHGALTAGVEKTAAGVPAADVARAVNRELERLGAYTAGNHLGYGTGIGFPPTWLDNLRIKETDPHVLEAGMVFFTFVHETVQHAGTPIELFLGEPILVADDGAERLSARPLTLDIA